MSINPWIVNSFVDTCAFDPKYGAESEAANEIFRLDADEGLGIRLAHSNQKEIDHPNTPACVKEEAVGLVYTLPISWTRSEWALFREIRTILVGQGKPENMEQDARHVFEAQKYGSYFVTTDGRLLQHADEIKVLSGVEILLPSKFLTLVQHYKNSRQR